MPTATMIRTAPTTQACQNMASSAWDRLNAEGEGFAVGIEDGGINGLEFLFGELLVEAWATDEVAVYDDGTGLTLVGDSHGGWAVRLEAK